MDLLSEIIDSLGWKTDLLARNSFQAPWGFNYPCHRSNGFHIVTRGECWFRVIDERTSKKGKGIDKTEPVHLQKGDILYVSRGIVHQLLSSPDEKGREFCEMGKCRISGETEGAGGVTTLLAVRFEESDRPLHPFFQELPEILHIKGTDVPGHHPLSTTLTLISSEIENGIGSDLILQRLADVLLYYVIRHYLEKHPSSLPGWRSAFFDEKIRTALENLHSRFRYPWTLEELAGSVGVSRATLANRFRETLGSTPMDYLLRLRIDRAHSILQRERVTLEEVADRVGYSSAFSFSRAFKRVMGYPPVQVART